MYINTLVQRKTKNRKKEIIKKYLKPALVPLLLLLAGVAIGFVMTRKKTSLQAVQPVSTVVPSQNIPEQKKEETPADQDNNTNVLPDDKQNSVAVTDPKQQKPSENQQTGITQERKENKNTEIIPKTILPEKKESVKKDKETVFVPDEISSVQKETSSIEKKSVEVDPSTGERKKVVRDNDNSISLDNNIKASPDRSTNSTKKNEQDHTFLENDHKDIRELVSLKTNNYLRGSFGGIKGLELTLYNNSGFLLDEVSVELQIMKPSEQPLRTDIITFKNISANGTVTVKVPDSQRGIRVDYKITNIASKQWQKNTAGL